MAKVKGKRKGSAAGLTLLLVFMLLLVAAVVFVYTHYNLAMGRLFKKGEDIDLRGMDVSVAQYEEIVRTHPESGVLWDVPIGNGRYDCGAEEISVGGFSEAEIKNFSYLTKLKRVDARAAGSEEALALVQSRPDLAVTWLVPIGDGRYDSGSKEIAVGDFGADEIEMFRYFTALERVDATAARCYDEIMQLRGELEDCKIVWTVEIGGIEHPSDAEEIAVGSEADAQELAEKLKYLPALEYADMTDSPIGESEIRTLRESYPALRFIYKISVAGNSYNSSAESIAIPESADFEVSQLTAHKGDFTDLKTVDLGRRVMSADDVIAIREAFNGAEVICRIAMFDKEFSSTETELDLSDTPMEDTTEAEKAIRAMPHLEKLYLINCDLDNESLDALNRKYEDVRVVWKVIIKWFGCRTDADNFCVSYYSSEYGYMPNEYVEPIKYCTDMVTLDLGHMDYDNIEFVRNMPHLRFLIIGGTQVSDLSPLRDLHELYYLEMFFTRVTDLSPLLEMTSLEHLNIGHVRLDDYTQLFKMTWLKRLWWVDSGLTEAQQQEIRDALPNTVVCFSAEEDNAVDFYWRQDDSYFEMRDNLHMPYTYPKPNK